MFRAQKHFPDITHSSCQTCTGILEPSKQFREALVTNFSPLTSKLLLLSLRQILPSSNPCLNGEVWILWSSSGFGWEGVSLFLKTGFNWSTSWIRSSCNWPAVMVSIAGVTCYQDIADCLKMVVESLRFGDIKPWVWDRSPHKRLHTALTSSRTGSVVAVCWPVVVLTSCRFTETAAALWAGSSCSRTTSRSTMCL